MTKLTFEFASVPQLRSQMSEFADLMEAQGTNGESLALYSNEELLTEIAMRGAAEGAAIAAAPPAAAANEPAVDKPKRSRGRPKKDETTAAAPPPAAAPAPALSVVPKPDKSASSVAPDLPDEDDVMALISQVYSSSNDMMLIRTVLQEVGGKTQLSQIPVNLWPALVERLQGELKRLQEAG